MKDRAILHIGFRSDRDQVIVAPNHNVKPDTGSLIKGNTADDGRILGDKLPITNQFRFAFCQFVQHQDSPLTTPACQSWRGLSKSIRASYTAFRNSTRTTADSPQI